MDAVTRAQAFAGQDDPTVRALGGAAAGAATAALLTAQPTYLWRPGGVPSIGVYTTLASLIAAAGSFLSRNIPIRVAVDDSIAAAVVPAGTSGLKGNYVLCSGRPDGNRATVSFAAGAQILGLPGEIDQVNLDLSALLAGEHAFGDIVNTATARLVLRDVSFSNLGLGRMVVCDAGGTLSVEAYGLTDSAGSALAIESLAGGDVSIVLFDESNVDANALGGAGTAAVTIASASADVDLTVAPTFVVSHVANGVYERKVTIALADLQAAGAVGAHQFNVGAVLPAVARLLRSEIDVTQAFAAAGLTAATATLEGGADAAGTILAAADATVAGEHAVAGTNPYMTRDSQQIKTTVTLTGATFNALTAGSLEIHLFVVLHERAF